MDISVRMNAGSIFPIRALDKEIIVNYPVLHIIHQIFNYESSLPMVYKMLAESYPNFSINCAGNTSVCSGC